MVKEKTGTNGDFMNGCREFRRLIIRFFSKDLTETEEQELNKHIMECANCKKEFVLHEQLDSMLKNRPISEAPTRIIQRVLSLIPEKREVYERPIFNWQIAICILCIVVAWSIAVTTIYFPPQLGFITIFVQKLLLIPKYTSIIETPYFIVAVVIYSIVFSLCSVLFFIGSQLREARLEPRF